jgi:uncharacterized protein (DUF2461 family)
LRLAFLFSCRLQIFFPESFSYFQTKQWRNRRYWDALEMRPIFHNFSQTPFRLAEELSKSWDINGL